MLLCGRWGVLIGCLSYQSSTTKCCVEVRDGSSTDFKCRIKAIRPRRTFPPSEHRLLSGDVIALMAFCFVYALVFRSVRVSVCEADISDGKDRSPREPIVCLRSVAVSGICLSCESRNSMTLVLPRG